MAYKELKLEKGAAKGLYDLWNSGMAPSSKNKKAAPKKAAPKKASAPKKK